MASQADQIFEAALKLSEEERLTLITRLMETVPEGGAILSTDDPALADELDRRFADPSGSVSWSQLRAESYS